MTDKEIPFTYIPQEDVDGIIDAALNTFGLRNQELKLLEEMSELQEAICKHAGGRDTADHICEEIADVVIMCVQISRAYGDESVSDWIIAKLHRLKDRIEEVRNAAENIRRLKISDCRECRHSDILSGGAFTCKIQGITLGRPNVRNCKSFIPKER